MKLFKSAGRYYCITPNRIYNGVVSKTFKNIDDCLEYAMNLPNMYVISISDSIFKYIKDTNHSILTRKDFNFC